jgi:hypothetical protein
MLLMLSILCCVIVEQRAPLPDSIPKGAVELKLSGVTLSGSEDITKVDVGSLKTGQAYYSYLSVHNSTSEPVELLKIETSCGCLMVWTASKKEIAPRSSSEILVLIRPRYEGGRFDQLIKGSASNGEFLRAGLSGVVVPPVDLEKNMIELSGGIRKFDLGVKFSEGFSMENLSFGAASKDFTVRKVGTTSIQVELTDETLSDAELFGTVASRITVKAKGGDHIYCDIPLVVRSNRVFVCKPSEVELRQTSSELFSGEFALFGKIEGLDFDSIKLVDEKGKAVSFRMVARSSRIARVRVEADSVLEPGVHKMLFVEQHSGTRLGSVRFISKGE